MSKRVILLEGNDPFWNLSVETYILEHMLENHPILMLWQNGPCVVIGRGQNPWLECDLSNMEDADIPFLRRQSGGGTVYQDLGNLNISLFYPTAKFDRDALGQIIVSALNQHGLTAKVSERHDVRLMHRGDWYKISGSAYRQKPDRALHHMTLLVNADLNALDHCLTPGQITQSTKGIKSVPSPVCNLKDVRPTLSLEDWKAALINAFSPDTTTEHAKIADLYALPDVQRIHAQLNSAAWRFEKTPPFSVSLREGSVSADIKHGVVQKIHGKHNDLAVGARWEHLSPQFDWEII